MKTTFKPGTGVYIFIFILVLISLSFYWYEIRPSNIRKTCMERASEEAKKNTTLRNGTFEITPEEETFVQKAAEQGFSEDQIIKGLEAKRKLVTGNNLEEDPFKGKTRSQFLKDAFMDGVTNNTELEKLGKIYDLLKGIKESKVEYSTTDKLKLEQAKLLNAPREKQLNYLYGEKAYRLCINEKGIKE